MKTNRLAISAGTAALALSTLIACSTEQPTAPANVRIGPAVFNLAGSSASVGDLIACKTGNAGSFTVVFDAASAVAPLRSFNAAQVNATLTPAGTRTYTFNLAAGACLTLYSRPIVAGVVSDPNVRAVITEAAGPTLNTIVVNDDGSGNEATSSVATRSASLQFNMFHDAMATFNNAPPPPPTGCTFTKGWYRNNGSETIIASADGLNKSQQQQVFNATPGQPGNVTWTGGNNTLNLYQQLLAAINNLGGNETGGPAAVDAAIAAAKAGTTVTTNNGGVQITLVAGTDVSGLISTLSAFNEGSLTGFPHCAD
jgi:molybdopterin-binding protein